MLSHSSPLSGRPTAVALSVLLFLLRGSARSQDIDGPGTTVIPRQERDRERRKASRGWGLSVEDRVKLPGTCHRGSSSAVAACCHPLKHL